MVTYRLLLCYFVITVGTCFQFGFHSGVINAPLLVIEEFIRNVSISRGKSNVDDFVFAISTLSVSAMPIGGLFGAVAGGYVARKCGRKNSMFIFAVPSVVGAFLLMFSKLASSFEMIVIGRLLGGFASGAYTVIAPMMLSEISPPSIRGTAGVLNQLVIVTAILIAQVLGLPSIMGTAQLWPWLLGLNIVPCFIHLVCLPFCPESPRHLYLIKKDTVGARRVLLWLRGCETTTENELEVFDRESEDSAKQKMVLLDLFKRKHLRFALLLAVLMQVSMQLSGINGLLYYSTKLFKSEGLSAETASAATLGIGAVNVGMTLLSAIVIEFVGRRVLHLSGLGIMLGNLILLTVCLAVKKYTADADWLIYLAIVSVYLFVAGLGTGPGSIPWFIVAELFTQETRDAATSLCMIVNWLGNITLGLLYPVLLRYLGEYSFTPFMVILLLCIVILGLYLPETKGQSPSSMEYHFKRLCYGNVNVDEQYIAASPLSISDNSRPAGDAPHDQLRLLSSQPVT